MVNVEEVLTEWRKAICFADRARTAAGGWGTVVGAAEEGDDLQFIPEDPSTPGRCGKQITVKRDALFPFWWPERQFEQRPPPAPGSKEAAYDAEIAPLMAKIIGICKERRIAVLNCFQLSGAGEEDTRCITALLQPEHEPSKEQLAALPLLRDGFMAFAMTRRGP